MTKLNIRPAQAGFTYSPGDEVARVRLQGGKDFKRKTKEKSTSIVNATWVLSPIEYSVFWAFYRSETSRGSVDFTFDLLLEDQGLDTVTASFIGTPETVSKEGSAFTISAQLEITLPNVDTDADDSLLVLYGIYGADLDAWLNRFEKLMNFDIAVLT
jgi:hypothetical protein